MSAIQPLLLLPEGGGPIQRLEPLRLAQEGHNEAWLRDFLLAHPGALPIREIDHAYEGAVAVCKELPTHAGPVDGLFVNANGALTILECKLWKNPEARRKVVAQILDYAREIASWRYSDLQRQVSRATGQSGNVLYQRAVQASPGLDEAAFVDSVSRRLRAGRFLLLIAGDGIHSGTEAIVDYMSRHSGLAFSLGLVELGAYRAPGGLLVQPRILAKTEVVRRTVVQVATTGPVVIRDIEGDGEPEEVAEPDEAADPAPVTRRPFDPEMLRRNREFWTAFRERVRFDDPDQPPPWQHHQNAVRTDLFGRSCYAAAWRSKEGNSGVYVSLRGERGLALASAIEDEKPSIEREVAAALASYSPFKKQGWSDEPNAVSFGLQRAPVKQGAEVQPESFDWLEAGLNALINAFRPRLIQVQREGETILQS